MSESCPIAAQISMHDDLPSAGLEQPWTVAASSGLNFALSAASDLWRTPRRCLSIALGQLIVGREELNFGGYASSIMVMDARLRRRRSNLRRDYSRWESRLEHSHRSNQRANALQASPSVTLNDGDSRIAQDCTNAALGAEMGWMVDIRFNGLLTATQEIHNHRGHPIR